MVPNRPERRFSQGNEDSPEKLDDQAHRHKREFDSKKQQQRKHYHAYRAVSSRFHFAGFHMIFIGTRNGGDKKKIIRWDNLTGKGSKRDRNGCVRCRSGQTVLFARGRCKRLRKSQAVQQE